MVNWQDDTMGFPADDPKEKKEERPGELNLDENELDLGDDYISSALAALENAPDELLEQGYEGREDLELVIVEDFDDETDSDDSSEEVNKQQIVVDDTKIKELSGTIADLEKKLKNNQHRFETIIEQQKEKITEGGKINKKLRDQIETLKTERDEAREEAEKNKSNWVEAVAEYKNVQRRSRLKMAEFVDLEKCAIIKNILPVFDNLKRSLDYKDHADALLDGVELIFKQFQDVFKEWKVSEIPAIGEPFDPHCHDAVMRIPDNEKPENTVVEVLQPGYFIEERVLIPAKVTVSYGNSDPEIKDSNIVTNSVESEKIAPEQGSDLKDSIEEDSEGGSTE